MKLSDKKLDELIEVLNLKKKIIRGETIYLTLWGNKTQIGIRETIKNILEEN